MSKPDRSSPETLDSADPLAAWTGAIDRGLTLRKNAATPAETRRLAKTLQRLHDAALQALADHPAKAVNPAWGETFIKTLDDLSNG